MGGAGEGCSGQRSGSGGHSRTCAAMEGRENFPDFLYNPKGVVDKPERNPYAWKITEI